MRQLIRILSLTIFVIFLSQGIQNELFAQKNSIRYSNPEKDSKKDRKKMRKERRLDEKRRKKQFKDKGLGVNKKSQKAAERAKRKKDKAGSHLDRVLTDKKNVSKSEKQAAYRRDRQISKANNRRKSKMTKKRLPRKRKPPKRKN